MERNIDKHRFSKMQKTGIERVVILSFYHHRSKESIDHSKQMMLLYSIKYTLQQQQQ